jgi:hypothetical protein
MKKKLKITWEDVSEEEEKVDEKFRKVLWKMNDFQFWTYVSSWYDEQDILDTMINWDLETKKQAIKEMKKVMLKDLKGGNKRNGKK